MTPTEPEPLCAISCNKGHNASRSFCYGLIKLCSNFVCQARTKHFLQQVTKEFGKKADRRECRTVLCALIFRLSDTVGSAQRRLQVAQILFTGTSGSEGEGPLHGTRW